MQGSPNVAILPPSATRQLCPPACHTQAEFILAHGTEALGTSLDGSSAVAASLERMQELLEQCAPRGLPMVVANPDVVTVSGSELRCAGQGWGSRRGTRRAGSRGSSGGNSRFASGFASQVEQRLPEVPLSPGRP